MICARVIVLVLSTFGFCSAFGMESDDERSDQEWVRSFIESSRADEANVIIWCGVLPACDLFILSNGSWGVTKFTSTEQLRIAMAQVDLPGKAFIFSRTDMEATPPSDSEMEFLVAMADIIRDFEQELLGLAFQPETSESILLRCVLTSHCAVPVAAEQDGADPAVRDSDSIEFGGLTSRPQMRIE